MSNALDPSHIMQTATAFWGSKVLLTAVELDLFTLGVTAMTASQLGDALDLHPRGRYDFFDALVALKFLRRNGDGPEGRYRNTPETAAFLNKSGDSHIGGLPEMLNARLFGFWNDLGPALKTGNPQNEIKHGGKGMFEELYSDEARLGEFLDAMTGFQAANFAQLAEKFDFSKYKTVSDISGAMVLVEVTSRLSAELREDEVLARYGGDEFVWVTAGTEDTSALEPLIERLRATLAKPVAVKGIELYVGISIGHAIYPDDGKNISALFDAADESMYRDKRKASFRT